MLPLVSVVLLSIFKLAEAALALAVDFSLFGAVVLVDLTVVETVVEAVEEEEDAILVVVDLEESSCEDARFETEE